MNYLLDTNACIALLNGSPPLVRTRFRKATGAGDKVFVSSIVSFELWYGVAKSERKEFNRQRLEAFFTGPIAILSFEQNDAEMAGSIRGLLETSGKPIGAYDVLIAGQALSHKLVLVTANVSEFSRVKGLEWQDWAKT